MSKSATSDMNGDYVAIFSFPDFRVSRSLINFTVYWMTGDSALSSPSSSSTYSQQSHNQQDIISFARATYTAADERIAEYAAGVYFPKLRDDGVKLNFSRTNVKEEDEDPGVGHATHPTSADTHRVVQPSTNLAWSSSVASASSGQSVLDLPSQPRIPSAPSNLLHNLPSLAASSSSPVHDSHCKQIGVIKSEDLPLQTRSNASRGTNARSPNAENAGWIYIIEIWNPATPQTYHFKIGYEKTRFERVKKWRNHYGFGDTELRGHIYTTERRQAERRIHKEVGECAISTSMPMSLKGNPCIATNSNGEPCRVMHREVFSFTYDAFEDIICPIVKDCVAIVDGK